MLAEANRLAGQGVDVVAALIETHDRADTTAMLTALERVPPRRVRHRGADFDELDIDAVLTRRPDVVLVDELAHTCAPGSRHEKRWEDVEELLDAGIDVITSLNVQHIDSLGNAVETATGVTQHETVPDAVIAAADRIDFIDVTPDMLRARIADTDVLRTSAAPHALSGFFTTERLTALRTLTFDWLDQHHRGDAAEAAVTRSVVPPQRVVATLTGAPEGEHVLRRAAQESHCLAQRRADRGARLRTQRTHPHRAGLANRSTQNTRRAGRSVYRTRGHRCRPRRLGLRPPRRRSPAGAGRNPPLTRSRAAARLGHQQSHPVRRPCRGPHRARANTQPTNCPCAGHSVPAAGRAARPAPRRRLAAAFFLPIAITVCLIPFRSSLGVAGAAVRSARRRRGGVVGGILPALAATTAGILLSDYYFTAPLHTLRVANAVDLVALITFGIVAIAVGGLVDLLTRQGGRAASAKAEAANLARLAADTVAATAEISPTSSARFVAPSRLTPSPSCGVPTTDGSWWPAPRPAVPAASRSGRRHG